jgi:FG-GAP-like repeat
VSGSEKIPVLTLARDVRQLARRYICASICLVSALLVSASQPVARTISVQPSGTALRSDSVLTASRELDRPAFRLGDAAKPFGWSTAVGDFNKDGQVDVAIADHIGRRTGAYAYRLEFLISGGLAGAVTFESVHNAVTISVADVDRDNDLDVVVDVPISGETVGIWLNDAHGHFTLGDVRQVPVTMGALHSVGTTDLPPDLAAFDEAQRVHDALPSPFQATVVHTDCRIVRVQPYVPRSALPSARTSPRAPPSTSVAV